jgi:Glycosyl transferase family 2
MKFRPSATLRHNPHGSPAKEDPGLTGRSLDEFRIELIERAIVTDLSLRAWGVTSARPAVVVAIPATDEEETLAAALARLGEAFRFTRRAGGLVVFANNCTDLTGEIVIRAAPDFPAPVILLAGRLTSAHAHAGWARRIALDAAANLCGPHGALLTTDADTEVAPDWVETFCAALDADFDLVCGRIGMVERSDVLAHAPAVRLARVENGYAALQDRVRHCCDQIIGRQPVGGAQPHYIESAASIGITHALYRQIGGLPAVPSSEDCALVRTAELAGARILYSSRFSVKTSNRLVGRARRGLAESLSRRLSDANPVAHQSLRPVEGIARMWANALAVAGVPHVLPVAIRHALLEDEWVRSMTEPRMIAADLEREIAGLAAFVDEEVEPVFAAWRRRYA